MNYIFIQKYLKDQVLPDGVFMEGTKNNPFMILGMTDTPKLERKISIYVYHSVEEPSPKVILYYFYNTKINLYIPTIGVLHDVPLPKLGATTRDFFIGYKTEITIL